MRLGLVIHDIGSDYFRQIIDGVSRFCEERDIDLFVYLVRNPNWNPEYPGYQDWALTKFLNENNIDGFILISTSICHFVSYAEFSKLTRTFEKIPWVSVGVKVNDAPSILPDSEKGWRNLIEHLIEEHNVREFAYVSVPQSSMEMKERFNIFKKVLEEHNIEFNEDNYFVGRYSFSSGEKSLQGIQSKSDVKFQAIVAATDSMAFGCISHLKAIGVSVPDDVIVTGYDDSLRAPFSVPSLSSVNQQIDYQGYRAAEILYDKIANRDVPLLTTIDTNAVFRNSCGCTVKDTVQLDNPTEAFLKFQSEMQNIQTFMETMKSSFSLSGLSAHLLRDFNNLEISQVLICLYENPVVLQSEDTSGLPKRARVYFATDKNRKFISVNENDYFDCSKSIVPEEYNDFFQGRYLVSGLTQSQAQYGYMIISFGKKDPVAYKMISLLIAKSIASAYELTKQMEENENLYQQNESLQITNKSLSALSRTDDLTGILNKRGFFLTAQQELSLAVEAGKKGLVLIGDVVGLSKINEEFGRATGDRAILAELDLLKQTFRASDTIGRLENDEFAVLAISLPMRNFKELKETLMRLCDEWNKRSQEKFKLEIRLEAVEFTFEDYDLSALIQKVKSQPKV